jgi:hypothetical protein
MREIGDGEAAVVFTGPPYFPPAIEPRLREPVGAQRHFEAVERDLLAFALSLRPVFVEIRRVLVPGGVLILQTKDVRYGRHLVPVAATHRQLAESTGLALVTRVLWEPMFQQASQRIRASEGGMVRFQVRETEEFLVFADPRERRIGVRQQLPQQEMEECTGPVWRVPGVGGRARHPHQSPPAVVRRLLLLHSSPGDLVVDPFAGCGGILAVAAQLGRRAMGYDIDRAHADVAASAVARAQAARGQLGGGER